MMCLLCIDPLVKCLVPDMIPYSFWPFPRTMVLVQNAKGVLALQQRAYFEELFLHVSLSSTGVRPVVVWLVRARSSLKQVVHVAAETCMKASM